MHPWGKGRRDARRRRGSDREAPAEATRRDVRLRAFHNGGYRGQNTVSSFVAGTVLPREEAARGDRVSSSLQQEIASPPSSLSSCLSLCYSPIVTFIPDRAHVTGAHDRTNPVTTDDGFGCSRTRTARNCPADLGTERQMLLVCQSSELTLLIMAFREGPCTLRDNGADEMRSGAYRLSSNAMRKVNDTRYMGGRCNPNAQHPGCPQRAIGTSRTAVSWVCLAAAKCVLRPHINELVSLLLGNSNRDSPSTSRSNHQTPQLARFSSLM
ncbi:hypothetical protein ALC53_02445 [Atta colombica]|uniref:Uncharacterized protein n=1 Tax=Atta colombica TaxID=520822 RepID=A0A195BRS3_9HYME|nr:hypothetical protein ALC53_02445 [Atta colombica]